MPTRTGALDRLLSPFTTVRAGEGPTALLLTFNVFLILTAYYVLKVLREPLILAGGGAEVKSYSAAAQAMLLLVLVPLYGVLSAKLPRRRLINVVTLFFVACLGIFFALGGMRLPIGVPFFLWVGIFNLMIVSQFWSFANDVYTIDEGKRLFPVVAFGASSGAVFGSWVAGRLLEPLGIPPMFLVAAALLVLATLVTNAVDARERRRTEADVPDPLSSGVMPAATPQVRASTGQFRVAGADYRKASGSLAPIARDRPAQEEPQAPPPSSAFRLVLASRYLLVFGLMILLLNWVNTTGEYLLGRTVSSAAVQAVAQGASETEEAFIGAFYARYFAVVNLVGLLLQLFLVSRIIKYLGVRIALLVLPVIALTGYAVMAFVPLLAAVRWAKTAENATDYSLQNTVRNVLFLPTTRQEKYAGKQVIDSFFVRAGDVLQAGLVYLGTAVLAFSTRQFALVCMGLVVVWLILAVTVGRRYERLVAVAP